MAKLTITLRQILDLRRALNSLDAVKNGKDGEVIPLEFDSTTRYRLMKNAGIVEREAVVYDKLERAFAQECCVYDGMAKNDENGRKMDAFNRKKEEALDQSVDLDGVLFVTVTDLLVRPSYVEGKPKTNPVPQSVLNKLSVIIEEEDEP